jgi:hypothetical protein
MLSSWSFMQMSHRDLLTKTIVCEAKVAAYAAILDQATLRCLFSARGL